MKLTRKTALVLSLFVLGAAVAESADARGRARIGVGLYFGVPLAGWGYYGYPYYPHYPYYPSYPASVVYVPSQPTTYIQQEPVQPSYAPQSGYWYYCGDARAYYPYVKECPGGWQRVAPQPAN
jgi:hypothetical protein